jgi:hypothetical protein
MSQHDGRDRCRISGKIIYQTKEEARAIRAAFRRNNANRGKVYRCPWGEHYHVTKGLCGNKGKGTHR